MKKQTGNRQLATGNRQCQNRRERSRRARLFIACCLLPVACCLLPVLAAADELANFIGVWRGQSLCTVKPNPCHDENVVYYSARAPKKAGTLAMTANKIVDGKEGLMGILECTWDAARASLRCPVPNGGAFLFQLDGRAMVGVLELADGSHFRRVLVRKDE